MKNFDSSPREFFVSLMRNKSLIASLIEREILGRYRGSFMGILWSFLNPVLMLAIYTFVFSVVFKTRWGNGGESRVEFALMLFAGLIAYNFFAECVSRASGLILENVNYVKKVVFPLEILPWVVVGSALFHMFISLVVWILAYVIFFGIPHATIFLIPFVILPLIFFTVGVMWVLASLGVYFRDISQLVGVMLTVLMFMSPVFYPVTSLPESIRGYLSLNPLTPIIEDVRSVLYFGKYPLLSNFLSYFFWGMLACCLGFIWFQRTRKGFSDVL